MLLRAREAAETLRVTQATVYQLIARGALRAIRVGRAVRIEQTAVEEFIANGGTRQAEAAGGAQPARHD